MDFQDIESFVCLAECLSFTEAAKTLYISQPTLSRQIMSLENQVGVRLFTRTKRSVDLTEAGKDMLVLARKMVRDRNEFVRRAGRVSEGKIKRLSLAYPTYFDYGHIKSLLDFMPAGAFRDVDLNLRQQSIGTILNDLNADRIDLAFVPMSVFYNDPVYEMDYIRLFRSRLSLVTPAEHRFAVRGGDVDLCELDGENLIMLDRGECPMEAAYFEKLCQDNKVKMPVAYWADSLTNVLAYIHLGVGVAVMSAAPQAALEQGMKCIPIVCGSGDTAMENVLVWQKYNENPALDDLLRLIGKK